MLNILKENGKLFNKETFMKKKSKEMWDYLKELSRIVINVFFLRGKLNNRKWIMMV